MIQEPEWYRKLTGHWFEMGGWYSDYSKSVEGTPIEKAVGRLLPIILMFRFPNESVSYNRHCFSNRCSDPDTKETCKATFQVTSQASVGPYKADFLIRTAKANLVIECDGHDFHERTKEQAEYDRKRDRWMQANGYAVLRFTGREITRDADKCVEEIVRFLKRPEVQP